MRHASMMRISLDGDDAQSMPKNEPNRVANIALAHVIASCVRKKCVFLIYVQH